MLRIFSVVRGIFPAPGERESCPRGKSSGDAIAQVSAGGPVGR